MDEKEFDDVLHDIVCISNLNIRRVQFTRRHKIDTRHKMQFDTVLLVTAGTVRVAILEEDTFAEFKAPHTIILERDKSYTIESLENYVELYDISALRHKTGDIVNPDNLVRANYPFDSSRSIEEQ